MYLNRVYTSLNQQVLKVIADVRKYGASYARRSQIDPTPVHNTLKQMYKAIIIQEANRMFDELKVKRASLGVNEIWVEEVKKYLDKYLLDKSVLPITEYSRKVILEALRKGIDEGLGTEEIVRLLKGLEDVNKIRAMRIVRTESLRAANFGHMLGANDSEYLYVKEWIAVDDARTRRTHRHGSGVDGEKVDFEQPFSNGLLYPGDPAGSAAEVVNCRCSVGFRVKRDANGRPMKKPQKPMYLRRSLTELLWGISAGATLTNLINELMNTE
jgi:hypothetical protein